MSVSQRSACILGAKLWMAFYFVDENPLNHYSFDMCVDIEKSCELLQSFMFGIKIV